MKVFFIRYAQIKPVTEVLLVFIAKLNNFKLLRLLYPSYTFKKIGYFLFLLARSVY